MMGLVMESETVRGDLPLVLYSGWSHSVLSILYDQDAHKCIPEQEATRVTLPFKDIFRWLCTNLPIKMFTL